MQRSVELFLQDIIDHCHLLGEWAHSRTDSELVEKWQDRYVVERGLQNIGEATFQIRRLRPALFAAISDDEKIVAMRHILVHAYAQIDTDTLVRVVRSYLTPLSEQARALLRRIVEEEPEDRP